MCARACECEYVRLASMISHTHTHTFYAMLHATIYHLPVALFRFKFSSFFSTHAFRIEMVSRFVVAVVIAMVAVVVVVIVDVLLL